jgi:hypothetical protein
MATIDDNNIRVSTMYFDKYGDGTAKSHTCLVATGFLDGVVISVNVLMSEEKISHLIAALYAAQAARKEEEIRHKDDK